MFADIGYEEAETKGLGWISGKVSKIDNQKGKFKLPHIGWNEIEIQKESKTTIILDMLHLKMVVVERVDLEILIFQDRSQIYLKIFLAKVSVEEEEEQEDLIIEALILDMIYQ